MSFALDRFREQAARELGTEINDHIVEADQMVELTPERREAIEAAVYTMHEVTAFDHASVLRAMLAETRNHEGA